MFDNKELTVIMSMVVNESVKLQKEINECYLDLEKESLERDLAAVNVIGSKISKVINADLLQKDKICCPNCGSDDLTKFNDDATQVFVCENCDYEFTENEVEQ